MKLIRLNTTSPYFNLAAEEYFLKKDSDDKLILWQNDNTIVIGRNQSTFTEINLPRAEELKVNIVRRMSGGGAVYHDTGNINFSYIMNSNSFVDLKSQLKKIVAFLRFSGLNAEFSGRNDIIIDGFKVSGTAQVSKNGRSINAPTIHPE